MRGEAMALHQLHTPHDPFDVDRRYVRFRTLRSDGFVDFYFSIGEPALGVELSLPLEQYKEFCRSNKVVYLTREQWEAIDFDQQKWRYGQPGITD